MFDFLKLKKEVSETTDDIDTEDGVGYGMGSLNKNWNKREESFSKAYQRGYEKTRNERRGVLGEGYEKAPILTGTLEAIGAVASPVRFSKALQGSPLHVVKRKKLDRCYGRWYCLW